MPSKVTRYKCEFCKRCYQSNSYAKKHEAICFKNPDRELRSGELAIWETLPNQLKQLNSYGVANSDWLEPLERRFDFSGKLNGAYKWWPKTEDGEIGLGFIYENGKWAKIPDYTPPNFAPGYSWRDELIPDIE